MFVFGFNLYGKYEIYGVQCAECLFTLPKTMSTHNIWIWSLETKFRKYGI